MCVDLTENPAGVLVGGRRVVIPRPIRDHVKECTLHHVEGYVVNPPMPLQFSVERPLMKHDMFVVRDPASFVSSVDCSAKKRNVFNPFFRPRNLLGFVGKNRELETFHDDGL